jgi:site-specific recombinase XerD
MTTKIILATATAAIASANQLSLSQLVERAGGAARFVGDEFSHAGHHGPTTQAAYQLAVRRFLAWVEGQRVELAPIMPGMVGPYLVGLGGSAAKRNQHLAALRGFLDGLVPRHVCILNPAASIKGAKEQVIERKRPEITLEQGCTLIRSVDRRHVVWLRDLAILATLAYTDCRTGAAPKLRLGDFQHDGMHYVPPF